MKIMQYKFTEYERRQFEPRGEGGRSVTEVFSHLMRFLDIRLLRNAPNLEEIEHREICALFAQVKETKDTLECFVPEPFAEVKRIKSFKDLTAKERTIVLNKVTHHIQCLRNLARLVYDNPKATQDQKSLALFFYNPTNVQCKKLGAFLRFPDWDSVYLINNTPVIALPGYKKADFVGESDFICEYISDDLDDLSCQSEEMRIIDHRHYKDYAFTYMTSRERDERNIKAANLGDAANTDRVFEEYTKDEEAKAKATHDFAQDQGAHKEFLDEKNKASTSATPFSSTTPNTVNHNHDEDNEDDEDLSPNDFTSGNRGNEGSSYPYDDYDSNSPDDELNKDSEATSSEDENEDENEEENKQKFAGEGEGLKDADFVDVKDSDAKALEVETREWIYWVYWGKHKWCLLGAIIGLILLALFIILILLMLWRPALLGYGLNSTYPYVTPYTNTIDASGNALNNNDRVDNDQGNSQDSDQGNNQGNDDLAKALDNGDSDSSASPNGGLGLGDNDDGISGGAGFIPQETPKVDLGGGEGDNRLDDDAPLESLPAGNEDKSDNEGDTGNGDALGGNNASLGGGDSANGAIGGESANGLGGKDDAGLPQTGSSPVEEPSDAIPDSLINNAHSKKQDEDDSSEEPPAVAGKNEPNKKTQTWAAARTKDFSIYFSEFNATRLSGTVMVSLYQKDREQPKDTYLCTTPMNVRESADKEWLILESNMPDKKIMEECQILFKQVYCKPTLGRGDCAIHFESQGLSLWVELKLSRDTVQASDNRDGK